jgi:hypothetical protein
MSSAVILFLFVISLSSAAVGLYAKAVGLYAKKLGSGAGNPLLLFSLIITFAVAIGAE